MWCWPIRSTRWRPSGWPSPPTDCAGGSPSSWPAILVRAVPGRMTASPPTSDGPIPGRCATSCWTPLRSHPMHRPTEAIPGRSTGWCGRSWPSSTTSPRTGRFPNSRHSPSVPRASPGSARSPTSSTATTSTVRRWSAPGPTRRVPTGARWTACSSRSRRTRPGSRGSGACCARRSGLPVPPSGWRGSWTSSGPARSSSTCRHGSCSSASPPSPDVTSCRWSTRWRGSARCTCSSSSPTASTPRRCSRRGPGRPADGPASGPRIPPDATSTSPCCGRGAGCRVSRRCSWPTGSTGSPTDLSG